MSSTKRPFSTSVTRGTDLSREWLANRLTAMREAAGMSQSELARRFSRYPNWVQRREAADTSTPIEEVGMWARECGFRVRISFEPVQLSVIDTETFKVPRHFTQDEVELIQETISRLDHLPDTRARLIAIHAALGVVVGCESYYEE